MFKTKTIYQHYWRRENRRFAVLTGLVFLASQSSLVCPELLGSAGSQALAQRIQRNPSGTGNPNSEASSDDGAQPPALASPAEGMSNVSPMNGNSSQAGDDSPPALDGNSDSSISAPTGMAPQVPPVQQPYVAPTPTGADPRKADLRKEKSSDKKKSKQKKGKESQNGRAEMPPAAETQEQPPLLAPKIPQTRNPNQTNNSEINPAASPRSMGSWKDKTIDMLFLTTRLNEGSMKEPIFGINRHLDLGAGSLEFGSATLVKPPGLVRPAAVQNGMMYREALRQSSELWWQAPIAKTTCFDEEQFYQRIKAWPYKICIYIHGYYKPFKQSLQDGAMLFSDYQHYEDSESNLMLPIVFTWPSAEGRAKYSVDEANIEWSYQAFESFMNRLLREKHPNATIDIVTHSMGARLPIAYAARDHADLAKPWFKSIYFCSPDVDFHTAEGLIKPLEDTVSNTVYVFVSDRDMPLVMSQYLHGQPRLGRPIDPPRGEDEQNAKRNDVSSDFFQQFASEALTALSGQGLSDTPEIAAWLKSNRNIDRELGERSRFIDVTNLVTANMGHGLAWSVLSGMLANKSKFPQLLVHQVHKKPDRTALMESFGRPRVLYRFTRLDPN